MVTVARARRTASFTARWGAVTAALCAVHVALALVIPEAPLRLTGATPAMAWGLLAQEFIGLGALAVLPALPGTWWSRATMSLVVMLVIGGGWIAFLTTDQFPGIDAVRFLLTVPEQAFEHLLQMRVALLVLVPLVTIAGTVVLTKLALHAGRESGTTGAKFLVLASAALFGGSLVFHGVANAVFGADQREIFDPRTGVSYPTNLFWDGAREDRGAAPQAGTWRTRASGATGAPVERGDHRGGVAARRHAVRLGERE